MSDEKPPSAFTDVRKGLGLLFRAARTTARNLPNTHLGKELEDVVVTSAREVGRAFGNVATTLEREVRGFGRRSTPAPDSHERPADPPDDPKAGPSR